MVLVAYKLYECPHGCGRTESAARPPFYSACPGCHRPAGSFRPVPVEAPAAPAKPRVPAKRRTGKRSG